MEISQLSTKQIVELTLLNETEFNKLLTEKMLVKNACQKEHNETPCLTNYSMLQSLEREINQMTNILALKNSFLSKIPVT